MVSSLLIPIMMTMMSVSVQFTLVAVAVVIVLVVVVIVVVAVAIVLVVNVIVCVVVIVFLLIMMISCVVIDVDDDRFSRVLSRFKRVCVISRRLVDLGAKKAEVDFSEVVDAIESHSWKCLVKRVYNA